MMDRALRNVETMPDDGSAAKLLGLDEKISDGDSETGLMITTFVPESVAPIMVPDAIIAEEKRLGD